MGCAVLRFVLVGFVLISSGAVADAQAKKVAELFPPNMLAYAEIDAPAALADAVAAIVKGSTLEDGLKLIHDRRDTNRDARLFNGQPALAFLTSATSPEFLAESRKFRGAAVGWTGFTKNFEPKYVAAILFGDSTAAGLIAKTFLANEATFRRIDSLDGVPIYQSRAASSLSYDPNTGKPIVPEPARATEGPLEATYAYRPGLFVVGSNKEAVADLLARYRGPAESFAASDEYKSLSELRKPGMTFCVRLKEVAAAADKAKKSGKDVLDPTLLSYLKLVLSSTAAPMLAGQFAVSPQGLTLTMSLTRDPSQPSPLLDLLDGSLAPPTLDVCPPDLAAVWTIALPKAQRTGACLQLADAVARAEGEVGKLPSDWLAELEQRSTLPIREKLLPSMRAVSLLLPSKQELPPKVEAIPVVALHLESEAAAEEMIAAIPILIAGVREVAPSRAAVETVAGVRVSSLADRGGTVHFARRGATLVVGRERKGVAACCAAAAGKNLAADFANRKLPVPDATTTSYATVLPLGLALSDQWGSGKLLNQFLPTAGRPDVLIDSLPSNVLNPQPIYTYADLSAAFGPMPPLTARVTKSAGKIVLDARLDLTTVGVQKVIDALIPVVEKLGTAGTPPNGRFYLDR